MQPTTAVTIGISSGQSGWIIQTMKCGRVGAFGHIGYGSELIINAHHASSVHAPHIDIMVMDGYASFL